MALNSRTIRSITDPARYEAHKSNLSDQDGSDNRSVVAMPHRIDWPVRPEPPRRCCWEALTDDDGLFRAEHAGDPRDLGARGNRRDSRDQVDALPAAQARAG